MYIYIYLFIYLFIYLWLRNISIERVRVFEPWHVYSWRRPRCKQNFYGAEFASRETSRSTLGDLMLFASLRKFFVEGPLINMFSINPPASVNKRAKSLIDIPSVSISHIILVHIRYHPYPSNIPLDTLR